MARQALLRHFVLVLLMIKSNIKYSGNETINILVKNFIACSVYFQSQNVINNVGIQTVYIIYEIMKVKFLYRVYLKYYMYIYHAIIIYIRTSSRNERPNMKTYFLPYSFYFPRK